MANEKEQAQLDTLVIALRKLASLDGWRFKISKGGRGWCHADTKLITIPTWAFDISYLRLRLGMQGFDVALAARYAEYYLAHEAAHARRRIMNHGASFMKELKLLCAPEIIQLELDYKPRNASAAGIKKG